MEEIKVEVTEEVKEILSRGYVEGCLYFLPKVQLSREEYVSVNKILELSGGKWNRSKKGHIFESEEKAKTMLSVLEKDEIVDSKKTYQFFETPSEIAEQLVELAQIKYIDDMEDENSECYQDVIEPSAGHGAICEKIDQSRCMFRCNEIDPEKCKVLEEKGYPVACIDFLTSDETADRFIMNPPFTRGQDVEHVLHAYSLLREGGRVVSIMAMGIKFNNQKKHKKLREIIEKHGEIIELPPNSFKESGTNVNAVIVVIDKLKIS